MHALRCPFMVVAVSCLATAALAESTDELQGREARLLAQVRAEAAGVPQNLVELALVRERLGRLQLALDTWGFLKKLHGQKTAFNQSSAPDRSYGELADFWMKRLRRKQYLVAEPPTPPDAEFRRKLGGAIRRACEAAYAPRDGQIDLAMQADLDGDLVDELLLVGKIGPHGERYEPFMRIAKWNGSRYEIVWRGEGRDRPRLFPIAFDVVDRDGDGWKEIHVGFEHDTGNATNLYFNGTEALMSY